MVSEGESQKLNYIITMFTGYSDVLTLVTPHRQTMSRKIISFLSSMMVVTTGQCWWGSLLSIHVFIMYTYTHQCHWNVCLIQPLPGAWHTWKTHRILWLFTARWSSTSLLQDCHVSFILYVCTQDIMLQLYSQVVPRLSCKAFRTGTEWLEEMALHSKEGE